MTNEIPHTLLVGPALRGGGAEGRFRNFCSHLFNGKNDVCVLSISEDFPSPNRQLFLDLDWKNPLSAPSVIMNLRNIILKNRYDIVVGFGFYPNILIWMAMFGLQIRPRLILNEITRPWLETKNSNIARKFLYRWLRKIIYPRCDKIMANSMDGVMECVQHFGVKQTRIEQVPNLISTEYISTSLIAKPAIKPNFDKYLLVLSRLDRIKNINNIIEAIKLLPTDLNCGLVVVGDGPERQRLNKLACKLGVELQVLFTGKLENPYPLLNNASALVLASSYEGFSNSVLEAMFCNVPVITSYCSSDAIDMCDKGAALGFEIGDVNGLCCRILELFEKESLKNSLVNKSKIYCQKHEVALGIKQYERVILSTINGEE